MANENFDPDRPTKRMRQSVAESNDNDAKSVGNDIEPNDEPINVEQNFRGRDRIRVESGEDGRDTDSRGRAARNITDRIRRNSGTKETVERKASKQETLASAEQLAEMFVATANTLAVLYTSNPAANMSELELLMIKPPIVQMLNNESVVKQAGKFAAPLSLIVGCSIWAIRVTALKAGNKPQATSFEQMAQEPENAPQDNSSVYEAMNMMNNGVN